MVERPGNDVKREVRMVRRDTAWADRYARRVDGERVSVDAETVAQVEAIAAERLNFFTDAVVAIAITLLALSLPVPVGQTNAEALQSVRGFADEYLAYFISFVVIATYWYAHHSVFRWVGAVGRHLRRWNMIWLFAIVTTPFATRVITGDGAFQVRFIFYAAVQALGGACFFVMLYLIRRDHLLRPGSPPDLIRSGYAQLIGSVSMFVLSIPISFVTHWAYATWAAIPFADRVVRRIQDRWFPRAGELTSPS
jgi:uncharacterized membrane protein